MQVSRGSGSESTEARGRGVMGWCGEVFQTSLFGLQRSRLVTAVSRSAVQAQGMWARNGRKKLKPLMREALTFVFFLLESFVLFGHDRAVQS